VSQLVSGLVTTVVNWFMKLKNMAVDKFNQLKSAASEKFESIRSSVINKVTNLKNKVVEIFGNVKSKATEIFNKVKTAIQKPIEKARDLVKNAIDKIKGFFNFNFSWPKLKMPHFGISPSGWKIGDLLKGVKPELSIDWYAKAMDNPMVMTDPTICGYNPATGSMMGGGEAGSEVVSGTNTLMKMISGAVQNENAALVQMLERIISLLVQFFPEALAAMQTPMVCDTNGLAIAMATAMNTELGKIAIKKGRGR
jgi:phage-related protein